MGSFRTLLWREVRDHQGWILGAMVGGPMLLAGLDASLSKYMPRDGSAMLLVPALLLLFCTVLGAELHCKEAGSKMAVTLMRLPISRVKLFAAKLVTYLGAAVLLDVWLMGTGALIIGALGGDRSEFLVACGNTAMAHLVILALGIGSLALSTWIKQSLPAVVGSASLLVGVPSLYLNFAATGHLLDVGAATSMWPVAVWWLLVCLGLVAAGLCANGIRQGVSFRVLRQFGAFTACGVLVLSLAGAASAGHWLARGGPQSLRSMDFHGASVSPDGTLLAIYIVGCRPGLGPTLGIWSDSTQKHMEGQNSTVERYSHGTWIYDLEQSSFIARIDDYHHATWTDDTTLQLSRRVSDGFMTETVTWDTNAHGMIGAPTVEPYTPKDYTSRSTRFQVGDWLPAEDLVVRDRALDLDVNLGPALQYVRRFEPSSALFYVTMEGDLMRYQAERDQPGAVTLIAPKVASGPCWLEVDFPATEARIWPRTESQDRVLAKEITFVAIESGKVETGPEGAYSFHAWSWGNSRSMQPGRQFESLSGPHKGALFFQAEQGLVELSSHDDYIVPLPKGKGFLVLPDRFAGPEVQLIHLDENGEPVAVIGSFLRN